MSLKNNVLTCNLKVHYSSISTARTEVEKLLKAWEIDAAIQRGPGEMTFDFLKADVIDRTPLVQSQVHFMSASASGVGTMSATPHVIRGKYPEVPKDFVINPNVEILWKRYEIYLDGRDQLLSMVYFCLSYLENLAGERGNIEEKYKINRIVINRLGNLSSARGDYVTARKGKDHKFKPISSNEKEWIEACIKKLIRRLGSMKRIHYRYQC